MNSSHLHARGNARPLSEERPTGQQFFNGLAIGGAAGVVSALCSLLGTGQWYRMLIRPLWAPAEWMFAPVQLLIFVLAGLGLASLWASQIQTANKRVVLRWFWTQLVLSLAWSIAFFVLHSLAWSYAIVMTLWCIVVALLWTGSRLSRRAFWFLAPLFFWVTFTSSLTFALLSFNILKQETARMDADPLNSNSAIDPPIIVRAK